jgi:hypothetical protein
MAGFFAYLAAAGLGSAMAQGRDRELLLVRAAGAGDRAFVESLLASGVAADVRDESGRSPLLAAVDQNHVAIAQLLIEKGADINAQAANLDTPWLLAGARGRTAILKLMLQTGKVDYTKRNRYGGNALIPACEKGFVDTVRLLLEESKISVNHVNNLGWTALLEAVMLGDGGPRHVEIVELLIKHKADVNLADKNGATPLAHARRKGHSDIARLLLAAGAR